MARTDYTGAAPSIVEPQAPSFAPRENIEATPDMFGGLQAAGMQRLGGALEQSGQNILEAGLTRQNFINQVSSDAAFNKFQQGVLNLTSGNPQTGQKGYLQTRGQEALSQFGNVSDAINSLRESIRGGLNGMAGLQFDEASRRLQMFTQSDMGRHYDEQSLSYAGTVNAATQDLAGRSVTSNPFDDATFNNNLEQARRGAVRNAQLQYGVNSDPSIATAAAAQATNNLSRGRVLAMASTNPTAALQWMQANRTNFAPATFDELQQHLKGPVDDAAARAAVSRAWPGSLGAFPGIRAAEGSGPNAVSGAGARGVYQITKPLFDENKRPGESFDSEADREAVSQRVLADYSQKYGGDMARVAVGWFNGPGNVAPPGSPTPYIRNITDPYTGVTTAAYVARAAAVAPSGVPAAMAPADLDSVVGQLNADTSLTPEQRDRAISIATDRWGHYQRALGDQRSQLESQLSDGMTALEAGKPFSYDENQIRTMFPGQKGEQILTQLADARTLGQTGVFVNQATPEQLAAKATELQAGLQNGNVPDFSGRQKIFSSFQQAVARRQKMLADDPAGFVMAESPEVQRAVQGIDQNNPATLLNADRAMLAEQTRLGVPASAQSVLTRPQAQSVARMFADADPATTDTGALIAKFMSAHGQYAGRAWGDLVKAGLSPQWQLLATINNPVDRRTYQQALGALSKKGTADFTADLPANTANDIKAGLDDAIADFRASAAVPGVAGNAGLISNMRGGMNLLAQYYSLQGMAGGPALQRAEKAMLGGYQFIPNPNDGSVPMRVPAALSGVRNYAAETQAALQARDLQPMPGLDPKLGVPYAQQQAAEAAASGIWVTSPDDQGLTLLRRLPSGLGWTPVLRSGGGRVEVRFRDIPKGIAAQQAQAAASTASPLLQPMTAP